MRERGYIDFWKCEDFVFVITVVVKSLIAVPGTEDAEKVLSSDDSACPLCEQKLSKRSLLHFCLVACCSIIYREHVWHD